MKRNDDCSLMKGTGMPNVTFELPIQLSHHGSETRTPDSSQRLFPGLHLPWLLWVLLPPSKVTGQQTCTRVEISSRRNKAASTCVYGRVWWSQREACLVPRGMNHASSTIETYQWRVTVSPPHQKLGVPDPRAAKWKDTSDPLFCRLADTACKIGAYLYFWWSKWKIK